jgi:hypothetical protein
MNVDRIVNKAVQLITPKMLKARRSALVCCINTLLQGNAATVTSIGRVTESNTTDKHSMKRADRVCSNSNLLKENDYISSAILHSLFSPHYINPWSDLDGYKRHFFNQSIASFRRTLCHIV